MCQENEHYLFVKTFRGIFEKIYCKDSNGLSQSVPMSYFARLIYPVIVPICNEPRGHSAEHINSKNMTEVS